MIKDNVVVVYEVLEEMFDNGFSLVIESNIFKELIKFFIILRIVVNIIIGMEKGIRRKLSFGMWFSLERRIILSVFFWGC